MRFVRDVAVSLAAAIHLMIASTLVGNWPRVDARWGGSGGAAIFFTLFGAGGAAALAYVCFRAGYEVFRDAYVDMLNTRRVPARPGQIAFYLVSFFVGLLFAALAVGVNVGIWFVFI